MSEEKTSKYNFPKAESVTIIEHAHEKIEIIYKKYSNDDKKLLEKFDELFARIDDNNSQMMDAISSLAMNKVQENIIVLTKEEFAAFEEVKKGKWETKLKFMIPLIPKIPFLGEFFPSASLEATKTIESEEYLEFVENKFYGGKLQTNILDAKPEPKGFLD